jgi:hypothetical protein
LLDVLRKRIDHRAFVLALVCQEEPAANECVDLGAVKFDGKTAKAGTTSRPATTHSACGGWPGGPGIDHHTAGRLPNHANVLSNESEAYCTRLG